jgi:hypothetical protein
MKTPREYTPLTRRAYGPAGRYRLYLGADHLLHVHEEYLAERYQRFYFSDIQAISLQRTATREIITLLHLVVMIGLALVLAAMLVFQAPLAITIFVASALGVLLLSILVNYLRGQSCACTLQTAVGAEQLYAVNRFRTAQRVLARIQPLIEAAQGQFNPNDLPVLPPVLTPSAAQPPPVPLARTPKHCTGRAHWALATLLAVDLVASLVDLYKPMSGLPEAAYSLVMLFGISAVLLAALVTQAQSDLPARVKLLTWSSLAFVVFALTISSIIPMIWGNTREGEVKFWGDIYSVLGEIVLCLGFWRGLRGRQ